MDKKRISFPGLIVFLALEWNSAEPSISQKRPGKEICDLKIFIFGISCIVCGNVFKRAWEDLASFLLGLCKEKEKVMKELWGIQLFSLFQQMFWGLVCFGLPGLQMAMRLWLLNTPWASCMCCCRLVGIELCCLQVTHCLSSVMTVCLQLQRILFVVEGASRRT